MTMSLRVVASKEISYKWRWLKTLSRDHTKRFPLWLKKKKEDAMERAELLKAFTGYSGRLPGWNTKEKGREEGEVDEGGEERRIKGNIVKEVVASIQEKVSVDDGVKNNVKIPKGQSFMRSWDCSQMENEEEEESWREGDHMAAQWDEEQKLGEIFERRSMEGSSVQMQNVPELFVHERVSQGTGVKGVNEKKKGSGWSVEKMKDNLSIAVE